MCADPNSWGLNASTRADAQSALERDRTRSVKSLGFKLIEAVGLVMAKGTLKSAPLNSLVGLRAHRNQANLRIRSDTGEGSTRGWTGMARFR